MERVFHNVKQGSQDWYDLRLGRITSSRFKDVMTQGRKKEEPFGQTAYSYIKELIAECQTGENRSISTKATEWGNLYEAAARIEYEDRMFVNVQKIGFCTFGDHLGASTDGLIGQNGVIEIKCPENSANHIEYCINGVPKVYIPQIQGELYVTGRDFCDFVSYDPRLGADDCIYIERVYRDESYISFLAARLELFVEEYKKHKKNYERRPRVQILKK